MGGQWHTIITMGNGGTEPTRAQVTLFYNGGQGKYRLERSLAPGGQIWLNLANLIRNQVPDSDGKTIPPDVMAGSYELRDLDHPVLGLLYEGKLVVDKTYGRASYGCAHCCGYSRAQLWQNPFAGPAGIDNTDTYQAYGVCESQWEDMDVFFNPHSTNTAVATLTGSTLHTVAVGSATASGKNTLPFQAPNGGLCSPAPMTGTQPVRVTPLVTGGNTVWWFNGQDPNSSSYPTSVPLSSSGGSSTTWSVTQADSKVSLSSTSGSQITVTSTGSHFSASAGDISITATANGIPSTPFIMTARTPWKLVFKLKSTTCFASPQTYSTALSYDVHDNLDTLISSDIFWNETLGSAQCENGSNWCNYQINAGGGDSNPVKDMLEPPDLNVNPPASPTPTCSGQDSGTTRYRSFAQTIKVGSSNAGAGVQAQSDTLGYDIDHGQHDSIQTPSQPPQ